MTMIPSQHPDATTSRLGKRTPRRSAVAFQATSLAVWAAVSAAFSVGLAPGHGAQIPSPRLYCGEILGVIGSSAYILSFLASGLWLIREAGAWPSLPGWLAWRSWLLSVLFSAAVLMLDLAILCASHVALH